MAVLLGSAIEGFPVLFLVENDQNYSLVKILMSTGAFDWGVVGMDAEFGQISNFGEMLGKRI